MHIAIFGTGGIGGYLAGKLGSLLEQTGSGLDGLSLIARGEHLEKMRSKGLTFIDVNGKSRTVRPTRASDGFSDIADANMIFLCVKGYDLESAVDEIAPHVQENTLLIPLLNGADIYERVRSRLEGGTVLPGAIYISAAITEPGTVQHKGGPGLMILGKGMGRDAVKPEALMVVLQKAEIPYEWHEDPFPAIWSKFLFISPFSLATAVTEKTLGEVLADETVKADVRSMMEEVAAVAVAKGVNLPDNAVEKTLEKAANFPPETRTSFQRDVEAGKAKTERDIFGDTLLRLGNELGVATPMTERYLERLP